MKTAVKPNLILMLLLVLILGIVIGILLPRPLTGIGTKETPDPHAGQVYLYDGEKWVWMTPVDSLPVNPLTEADFRVSPGRAEYLGTAYQTEIGVDVSWHQHEIDWKQVASSGIDFAYIRLGRRGYTEGGLFEDDYFEDNYRGASQNGLKLGVYFYSQAISAEEAREEAQFVLDTLQGRALDLPIIYDWEKVDNEDAQIARTRDLDHQTRTDCAVAFCEAIRKAGYDAGIYFNKLLGYYGYDLERLGNYPFWLALPDAPYPAFYYQVACWQFSWSGSVPGIEGEADMNMHFIPLPGQFDAQSGEP